MTIRIASYPGILHRKQGYRLSPGNHRDFSALFTLRASRFHRTNWADRLGT